MGYRTGAKVLILAMFAFYFLRYSPFLSISLGLIAGLTSGFISSWWHAKEDYITDEATGAEIVDGEPGSITTPERRPVRYGFGVKSARQGRVETRARPSRGVGWLFRRNRS
jgi:hypothetical protein